MSGSDLIVTQLRHIKQTSVQVAMGEYFSVAQFLTVLASSHRIHGQLVRLYARGIEDGAVVHNSDDANERERTSYTNSRP